MAKAEEDLDIAAILGGVKWIQMGDSPGLPKSYGSLNGKKVELYVEKIWKNDTKSMKCWGTMASFIFRPSQMCVSAVVKP